jgi:hypothetical protein
LRLSANSASIAMPQAIVEPLDAHGAHGPVMHVAPS